MRTVKYLFGDDEIAARRLELLANVYQESTRAFLVKAAGGARFGLAVDLGCGPGFTTTLIADILRCDHVLGLDASASFITLAEARSIERVSFAMHDVTSIPFPCGKGDLIFCRLLLTHLKDPLAVIVEWTTQLNAGGLLMVEEIESIRTKHPAFEHYISIVEAMLLSQSNRLDIGAEVGMLTLRNVKPVINEIRAISVKNCDAAGMFVMNMKAWKDSEFVRENYQRVRIGDLERELGAIAASRSQKREIEWQMRQRAWRRE
jgi:trans-aconitate 2-methyltransferase